MNELKANLKALLDGNGCYTGDNGLELLKLDLDTIEEKLAEYKERIETLEWSREDYFTIDKEIDLKKTIIGQFVTDKGEVCEAFENFTVEAINDLVEDINDDVIELMEKEHVDI